MKQILATFPLRNFLRVFALVAVVSATSCSKDPAVDGELHGDMLRFAVAEADGWNTQLRCGAAESEEKSAVSPENVAEVFSLRGENPADTLFLHASVADGIAAPYPNVQTDRLQTRATPVETGTFYDSFGVLASVYTGTWSEDSCLPDYMYDVEVTEASSWTTSYYWPGAGRNIRFFAYAPYGGQGIVLSDKTSAGTPSITYTVPTAVADQQDLLVAATSGMAGNTAAAAPLSFAHALTAVRFTTGNDMMSGRITKITLKGVYGSGSHTMGSDSWNGYGATTDFSQTLAATVDGSADQEITPVAATFMMLPQTLPSGASIEVVYTDDLTSTQRTLTASIAGSQWPMGRTVTYRISTSSIVITPTFTVMAPANFTYAGGSENYSVTSYAAVSRPGDATRTVPVAWTAEFVEDDGSGGYNVIARPEWLTAFTASGNGGTSATSFSATIAAQTGVTSNSHNETLKMAASVSGTYDLSTSGGTTVTNYQGIAYKMMPVNIGWCDAETTTYDARSVKVRFTQAETGAMQVITLTQASHSVVNSGNQPYFQFGRKDPMLAGIRNASGSTVDKGCYSDGYAFDKSGTGKVAIGVSIQHPHIFYNYGSSSIYDWCATSYSNLWSGDNTVTTANDNAVVKTIYDPSPVGYHLPSSNAFTGFTYNGSNVSGSSYFGSRFNSPYTSTTDFTDNFGWEFYCNKMTGEGSYDTAGGTIFFPASGYRSYSAGAVNGVGSLGYFWSAVPYSTSYGRSLSFRLSYIYPLSINYRSDGFAVRPVQE